MAYTRTTWVQGTAPAINATNLNNMEVGIEDVHNNGAFKNAANTFTEAQRTQINAGDNSIAFNDDNNFAFTATAADITVTNQTVGQSGTIVITTSENITGWGTEFDWGNQGVPTGLTGVETFGYFISGASGVDSIKIGRV